MKIALLDDYAKVGLKMADWSAIEASGGEITVFDRHLSEDEAVEVLAPFNVLCTIRERMALPRTLIEKLPNLKLITIIGQSLPNLDTAAATEHGIRVAQSNLDRQMTEETLASASATPELAWGLIIAAARHLALEERRMRDGKWQVTVGEGLYGKTLGLLGLGHVGKRMATYAQAFGMKIIAWSENMMPEQAKTSGAVHVDKGELFAQSDVLSIHVKLSDRTRGLVQADDLARMKPSAYLVNTSRGPIVDEAALLETLRNRRIAGAALDVFDQEPLPADHPFRSMDNVTLSPHLGYVTVETLRGFYGDTAENVAAFMDGQPIRIANAEAVANS